MFVAHAFHANGSLAYTRAGFTMQCDAEVHAAMNDRHGGGWVVVSATPQQWAAWVGGSHYEPVNDRIVARGDVARERAA